MMQPSTAWDKYVGGTTPDEFLGVEPETDDWRAVYKNIVRDYCSEDEWPWDEPCTKEIKTALLKYIETYFDE